MLSFLGFIALLGAAVLCDGQIIQEGQCDPSVPLHADFNITQFLGIWYENSRTPNDYQNADCSTFEFTGGNGVLTVRNEAVNNNFNEDSNGTATYNAADPARMTLNGVFPTDIDFWVLTTDYENFALFYSCQNVGNGNRSINLWKMSRASTYASELVPAIMDQTILTLFGVVASDTMIDLDHSQNACARLPMITPGNSVIIPGQCEPNMTVVQNFDAGRFVGRWHEIASYFSESALGDCPTANYAANPDGTVAVVNTQVINQTLLSISGTAVVASTDGSAVLDVTLEIIPGVFGDQRLFIIASDYDNYAVSYACVNVSEQEKRVYSWILSRSRELSPESAAAVQTVVDSIIDLNNQFYAPAAQSDDDCFYFPEPEPNQPVVFPGPCNMSIPAMANFNPVLYQGLWHEIEGYPSSFQDGTCNNALYTLNDAGFVDVYNTQVINQTLDFINGIATVASDDGSAKLEVVFPVAGTNLTISTSYWVLDTDYTSYSLVYTCQDIGDERGVFSWKLSRTRQLSAAANAIMDSIIADIQVLDPRYYQLRNQSDADCFYVPEPVPNQQVVFPGQCNDSIAAVPNFDLNQFQGIWYEVEAYPKDDQPGTCISHEYTASTPGSLSLVSNQIIDQFLSSSNGTVTISSNDTSGRLTINIVANGENIAIPFWILATDYTSYALAYSCVNNNDYYRGVFSWKLSRNTTLTPAAVTAIDNTIGPIEVLDNIYYETIDQTAAACATLPEIPPGQPIILDGQCNQSIPAIQNFDAARFSGYWRILESYPQSTNPTASCMETTFGFDNSFFSVTTGQVANQTLDSVTGQATIAADGSGTLTASFPVVGIITTTVTYEFLILDTDYDNYALMYSCTNLNSNQRQISSWKFSRTTEFSVQDNASINAVISTIDVLNNRYYETIGHTFDDCFYVPEPNGQPVTFRGQCNMNIPTVPGFDAVAYMGLWHEIEAYPSQFQQGTCNNAYYSLDAEAGVVDVYNTQVIGQTLFDIYGTAVPVSDDGKLEVSFPVEGTNLTAETSYWVLATDYTSYSLVYTCQNIDDQNRAVWSWKLGRNKGPFSAEANNAMNAVINSIDVLDQRLYDVRNQTAQGCFYFPEPTGEPVVFPGSCSDSNVATVVNFDMERFAGIWHEISGYPKETPLGDCVNYEFTVNSNLEFSLVSTEVTNQTVRITNAVVTRNATNNSQFTLTMNMNGTEIQFPYFIIMTNYDEHALAYSCVDRPNDRRAVYSWKLSRTRNLLPLSNSAINTALLNANHDILDNRYYVNTVQTEESCFYYPPVGGPVVFPGHCDMNIPTVEDFDPVRYAGQWYDIESYYDDFQNGECNDARYTLNEAGTVDVFNTQVINETLDTISGVAATTDISGRLVVTFPIAGTNQTITSTYWILATDYTSYSFVYSCTNVSPITRRVFSWKLSRTRSLNTEAQVTINSVSNNIDVLDERYYVIRDHSPQACFYFPEPIVGQRIEFRGQCDESIEAVPDFDVAAYTGFWYDTGSYPQQFQFGQCANANYTLDPELGVVQVYNTQVFNQTFDFIYGTAAIDPTANGTGKLLVSFNLAGPPGGINIAALSPYWILSTDYVNYALVYSCVNTGPETHTVSSWKLSRQPTLSAASNEAINSVTENIQVLDDRLYLPQDHDPASCFYYPEVVFGQQVVFPGTCNENIQVVQNFNLQSFAGIWHEISAYPLNGRSGAQCASYEFTNATANSLDIVTRQIIDFGVDISYGSLERNSTDNSARFTITLNIGNNEITLPYWIIDTDYENYALAYSCVDYDNNTRGVWSWKLSREQQLSTFADTAINQLVDSIEVLDERYYEESSQSDDGCFYLPEIGNDEPAIFMGQCDESIPAVADFDPVRYQGQWYDLESYYDQFQMGTCNDAQYTLNAATGVVDVYNTQVVNEALDTIDGTAVLASTDGTGKLLVTFPVAGTNLTIDAEYWILDTDYDSYSLVYSCSNLPNNTRRVFSWKLSRSREMTAAANTAINNVISQINVLNERFYIQRDHSEDACFYYPDLVPGEAVTFRGQCNTTVVNQVVQNFDVLRYTGLWYDVGSYPQEFQFGTCPTATYTFNEAGGYVDVYNTQVVNQQLDDIYGEARVVSTDGSAQLLVTFPIAGTNLTIDWPYWVLDTDYDNYAVVYACVNTGVESYRVTSWRLSRQPNVTAAAQAAYNQAISNVRVLDERYYINRGNTEQDCFYYPENNGGPVFLEGSCIANQSVVSNFNSNLFSGTWYEQARFPSELQEGTCATTEMQANNQQITLTQTIVNGERLTTVQGVLNVPADGSGVLTATFTGPNGVETLPIYVLDTDYTSYALLFSCRDDVANSRKQVYSWQLSRNQAGLTPAAIQNINAIVSSNIDLFDLYYDQTDQSNAGCFYYPDFDASAPIITLPGPCDETIQGVPNFNAAGYLGRWFEISAYPAGTTQIGECARAEYSLGDTGVDVYHTVVSNQTLEIVTGVATVATTDGSGVLDVVLNLPIGPVFANYYILATDYTNYALVYSCRNLTDNTRQVTSWKLSRQPTLAAQFEAIMDTVINSTQGLLQEYYQPTSQSDEDCFYIPELVPTEPVVFRGQCQNISGVPNFNAQNFLGWWHEIEAYPTGSNSGNCRSSQIEANGNQFVVTDIDVFGQQEFSYVGSNLEVTADGRLRRINSNGEYTDVWVLATDYDNYALLYSCENINNEYRQVWSAKHSKSRSLSAQSQAAIQQTIDSNQVLANQLYLPVDQSDQACFHYPAQSGQRVIIPGQCDQNIPAVNDFDAVAYTGTWYQIEKYPQQWESGSCVGARYSLDASTGVVDVINWEVINGTLDTIVGTAVVSSTDGSARLLVTLPIVGTEETTDYPLYVLSTDYVSYSLAYSCENINDYQRAIGAWKLSRTRSMPAEGNTAINNVIAQRPELHQPYFEVTEQDEDCEEPSAGYLVSSSFIVMIVCSVWHLFM